MQLGWRIIPLHRVGPDGKTCSCKNGAKCPSAGKHPKALDWSDAAPMSAPDVYATWDVERPPNLGVVTGEPSGIWVLDIDGEVGKDSMKRLIEAYGPVPKTRLHQTGSGGYHFIFRLPDGFKPKTHHGVFGDDYPNIDVRGVGGQIVLPPSKTSGVYTVKREEILDAPQWLLDLVPQVDDEREPIELAEDDLLEYAALPDDQKRISDRYIDSGVAAQIADLEALPRPWREGAGWDQGVHRAACRLFELAQQSWSRLTYREAYELLVGHAPQDAEWGKAQIEQKWLSAQTTVGKKELPRPKGVGDQPAPGAPPEDWDFGNVQKPAAPPTATEREDDELFDRAGLKIDGKEITEPTEKSFRFLPEKAAKAIKARIPVAMGPDQRFWTHKDGVWSEDEFIVRNTLARSLGDHYKRTMVGETEDVLSGWVKSIKVGPTPEVINFKNGMLKLATGELGPHDPDQFSTTQIPHNYNPDATCPNFDRFLEETLTPESARLAWEAIAAALYNGRPIQRAILLFGPPASGKSRLLALIGDILGDANISHVTLHNLKERFHTAELFGKTANICADIDSTHISETGMFKMLVGGDEVLAERKNRHPFKFRPFATQFFSANTIPGSDDRSGAWTRRFAVIRFRRTIPKDQQIPDLDDILARECEGVIAKALRILPELLLVGQFSVVDEDQDEFETETDVVRQFIRDELILGAEHATPAGQLANRWRDWAMKNEIKLNWRSAARSVKNMPGVDQPNNPIRIGNVKVRGWTGVALRPDTELATWRNAAAEGL